MKEPPQAKTTQTKYKGFEWRIMITHSLPKFFGITIRKTVAPLKFHTGYMPVLPIICNDFRGSSICRTYKKISG